MILDATGAAPESTSAQVTLKTATHQAALRIKRIHQGDLTNKGTVIDEARRRLFSLHQGVLLAMDFPEPPVRDYFILPSALIDTDGDHSLVRDPATGDLLVSFPAAGVLARFDPETLTLRSTLALPSTEPDAQPTRRRLAGIRSGRLYFICHKPSPYATTALKAYPTSHVEVRSATNGALVQRLDLSSPSIAYPDLTYLSSLAFHPTRPEAWLVIGHADEESAVKLRLARFDLDDQGRIGSTLTDPKLLLTRQSSGETPDFAPPAFCPSRHLAAYLSSFFDDETLDEVKIPGSPPYVSLIEGFSEDGRFAITRCGLLALDTGSYFSLQALGLGNAGTNIGTKLTADNRHLIYRHYENPRPRALFLPKACAALALAAIRTPLAESTVLPPDELAWPPIPGAQGYRIYLAAEGSGAPLPLIGETVGDARLRFDAPLASGLDYVWRVDTLADGEVVIGAEQRFHVRGSRFQSSALAPSCVVGTPAAAHPFKVEAVPGASWRIESSQPWMTVSPASGVGPATVELLVDARDLPSPAKGTLTLVGPDGSGTVPVDVQRLFLTSPQSYEDQSPAALFAIGGYSPRHILRLDALTGEITHSRDTLIQDGFILGDICYLPSTDTLYASSALSPEIRAYSASDLMPLPQAGRTDALVATLPFSNADLRAAPAGRLWCLGADRIGLLSPGDTTPSWHPLPKPEGQASAYYDYYLTSTTAPEFVHVASDYSATTFTATRYHATSDGIILLKQGVFPRRDLYQGGANTPGASTDLSLLLYKTVLLDGQLESEGYDFTDLNAILSSDGSMLCSSRMLRFGPGFGQARLLPPDHGPLAIHASTGRLLLKDNYPRVKSVAIDSIPLVEPVDIASTGNSHASLGLQIKWPNFTPTQFPSGAHVRVRYRPVGSTDWLEWQDRYAGEAASPDLTWNFAPGYYSGSSLSLLPDTTYEVSVRFESKWSITANSFWSPVLVTTTKTLPPARDRRAAYWKEYNEANQGAAFSLSCATIGKDLQWSAAGLPPE